ncbi:MAG: ATP phosphoribosyltransferase regulatory subunit [Alkalispirochaeta sp.]
MNKGQIDRRLSLPTGTETLHLQEVARHRRITRRLADLFEAWGYRPVDTPIVDYYEVYRPLLNDEDVRQTYRAVDRQGEILMLRSDTTMFLAKQLGLHLTPEELPMRGYYDMQIVRAEEIHDISRNEFQQAGVELVGVPGSDGDREILVLAIESLTALGVSDHVIHIGSHYVINTLLPLVPEDARTSLIAAVRHRRFSDHVVSILPDAIQQLLRFIGSPGDFAALVDDIDALLTPETRSAVRYLQATVEGALAIGENRNVDRPDGGDIFRIDLSELGSHGYYTGIAFAAYLPAGNTPVLRGGRYDHLLRAFGIDAPSVGFSMFPRKLPSATMVEEETPDPDVDARSIPERYSDGRRRIE